MSVSHGSYFKSLKENPVLLVVFTSFLTSLCTLGIIKLTESPKTVILRDKMQNIGRFASGNTPIDVPYFFHAAAIATPAVVSVNVRPLDTDLNWDPNVLESNGSGVIISDDGFIVTNRHVLEDGNDIVVTLFDKRKYNAKLIGIDPATDIALIKIEAEHLSSMKFGNSDLTKVGEWVLAVGNPFNLESTVTAGIISAKGRNINILDDQYRIESFIQTDAVVNPGNSGGALVNVQGDIVGINTAIMTKSGSFEGYSFAIPSNLVAKIVKDLRDFGSVQRGLLGINIDDITQSSMEASGLKTPGGVIVSRIAKGSGAAEADIRLKDIILTMNESSVNSVAELQEKIARLRPGDRVQLSILRNGNILNKEIALMSMSQMEVNHKLSNEGLKKELGMELRELEEVEKISLHTTGALVEKVHKGNKASALGIENGYVITRINDIPIHGLEDAFYIFENSSGPFKLEGIYGKFPGNYTYIFSK